MENNFRNVKQLGWVSLLNDISSEMLYAVTPLLITQVLGASAGIVGLIEGIAEGTASILKGAIGWYSDRISRRKRFVVVGYILSAIAKPLIAIAFAWPMVMFARFVDRVGKGVRTTARDALIADSSPPELRGKAFGLHRAMDTAGALIGVAVSLTLVMFFFNPGIQSVQLRLLYWLAFIPAAVGIGLMAFVRDIPLARPALSGPKPPLNLKFGSRYYSALALYGLATLGFSSDAFLILRATDVGFSTVAVIAAYLLFNLSYAALAYPLGRWSDRTPKELLLALGLFVYAIVYFGFALLPAAWLVWPLFLLYGLFAALTDGVSKAMISNLVPADSRGTALGLFYLVTGLLAVLASVLAGWMWDAISAAAPFYLGAGLAFVAGVGMMVKVLSTKIRTQT